MREPAVPRVRPLGRDREIRGANAQLGVADPVARPVRPRDPTFARPLRVPRSTISSAPASVRSMRR
jgi:hypothetical protein